MHATGLHVTDLICLLRAPPHLEGRIVRGGVLIDVEVFHSFPLWFIGPDCVIVRNLIPGVAER